MWLHSIDVITKKIEKGRTERKKGSSEQWRNYYWELMDVAAVATEGGNFIAITNLASFPPRVQSKKTHHRVIHVPGQT